MMSSPFTCIVRSIPRPSFSADIRVPSARTSPKPSRLAILSMRARMVSSFPQERSRPSASSLVSIPLSWSSMAQAMLSAVVRMSSPSLLHRSFALRAVSRLLFPTLDVNEPWDSYSGPSP